LIIANARRSFVNITSPYEVALVHLYVLGDLRQHNRNPPLTRLGPKSLLLDNRKRYRDGEHSARHEHPARVLGRRNQL